MSQLERDHDLALQSDAAHERIERDEARADENRNSLFDQVSAIAKGQADAYRVAYNQGYDAGYLAAMRKAGEMIDQAFPSRKWEGEI